jgi:hypothetical protein
LATILKYSFKNLFLIQIMCCVLSQSLHAQENTTIHFQTSDTTKAASKPTIVISKEKHDPKKATNRSLILPGWGQAYNKQYWKIPLVYGALSIPTITFFYNNNVYKEARFAYDARYAASAEGGYDSTAYKTLDLKYQKADINAIQSLRNAARRDRDYSVLWFLIVWGLNVADATVFGHLKDFDVSNNLSLNVHPTFNPTTRTPALNLAFKLKDKKKPTEFIAR